MRSNPIENLRTFVMLNKGLTSDEMLDTVEWLGDVLAVAKRLASTDNIMVHHVEELRAVLDRRA